MLRKISLTWTRNPKLTKTDEVETSLSLEHLVCAHQGVAYHLTTPKCMLHFTHIHVLFLIFKYGSLSHCAHLQGSVGKPGTHKFFHVALSNLMTNNIKGDQKQEARLHGIEKQG